MNGIVDAVAVVGVPEDKPLEDLNEARAKPTISVMLGYIADDNGQPPIASEDVQRFAAGVVPGMPPKDVFVRMVEAPKSFAPSPEAATCTKTEVLGTLICVESRARIATGVLVAATFSALLAALTVIAILRAMRYRRELTRLTAKVAAA